MAAEESKALVSNWYIRGGDAYRVLVGRPEGNRPFGRPRCRWVNNIKIDIQEVVWGHGLD